MSIYANIPSIKFDDFVFDPDKGFPIPSITTSIASDRTASYQYLGSTQTINLKGYIYDNSITGLINKALLLKSGVISSTPKPFLFNLYNKPVISGSGYVTEISFDSSERNGVDILDYNISIDFSSSVTGRTTINDSTKIYNVSNVEDNLTISISDKNYFYNNAFYPLYDITRTTTAQGNYTTSSGAIIEAVSWVNDRKRMVPSSSIIPSSQFPLFNHVRNLNLDELEGKVSITDTFVSKPFEPNLPWTENFTIDTNINSTEEGITTEISLKGSILGLVPFTALDGIDAPFDINVVRSGQKMLQPFGNLGSGSKYDGALSGYNAIVVTGLLLPNRALGYYNALISGIARTGIGYTGIILPLNTGSPAKLTETFDPFNGQITYDIAYSNTRQPCISGALPNSENINISDSPPLPRTTNISVLGRRLGPVVYPIIDSSGVGTRSITYEASFPTGDCRTNIKNRILRDINNLIDNYQPKRPYTGYVTGNEQSVNLKNGRITHTKTWTYIQDK